VQLVHGLDAALACMHTRKAQKKGDE
jgi:hypothetical protein